MDWEQERISLGNGLFRSRNGDVHACEVFIFKRSLIPDVYVKFYSDKTEFELYEDDYFKVDLMHFLQRMGYKGHHFDRAELGMQGHNFVVFEPGKSFESFAKKLGWIDEAGPDPVGEQQELFQDNSLLH
jgi:hypothetical protein